MPALTWISDSECNVRGRKVIVIHSDFDSNRTDADRIILLKDKRFFDRYVTLLNGHEPQSVLEIGIFEGGSVILFAEMWPNARVVGVDLRAKSTAVQAHLESLGFANRVSLNYEVSQDNGPEMNRILIQDFGAMKIDLVIDDASHLYTPTRGAFNIAFPYVAVGGWYVIEDWGWAHWRDWQTKQQWSTLPALSNLIFELVMANASSPGVIAQVQVNQNFVAVQRGKDPLPASDDILSGLYVARGKALTLL
jgi:SAM-dependent methyltransferase